MNQQVVQLLADAHEAQGAWATQIVRHRLRAVGRIAERIAAEHAELVSLIPRADSSSAEILASEILPLADACRFTASVGGRVLAPHSRSFRHGAWWMGRIAVSVVREPWGLVLVLAPSNYPLFLPGVQIVQALAAGNAVLVKPAPGCAAILERFKQIIVDVGIPESLIQVLDTSIDSAQAAIQHGVDKVILTGSINTGHSVMSQLAETMTPATMELSGCDAVFVTAHADLMRVARCIAFGMTLNGGATCIAPRRIFVLAEHQQTLAELLAAEFANSERKKYRTGQRNAELVSGFVREALDAGGRLVYGKLPSAESTHMQPLVLADIQPDMAIAREDLFAPVTSMIPVKDMSAALIADRHCPYSLGASVFGPHNAAEHWAAKIEAGCVVINDVIAPTADPRVTFGGRNQSGWGVTRGMEGLLSLTRPKTICARRGNWLPHLDKSNANNAEIMAELLQLFHAGSFRRRLQALRNIVFPGRKRDEQVRKRDEQVRKRDEHK